MTKCVLLAILAVLAISVATLPGAIAAPIPDLEAFLVEDLDAATQALLSEKVPSAICNTKLECEKFCKENGVNLTPHVRDALDQPYGCTARDHSTARKKQCNWNINSGSSASLPSYYKICAPGPLYRLAAVGEVCDRAPEELCKTIAADKTFHYNQDQNDAIRPAGCFRDAFYPNHVFYNKHLTGGNYAGPYQQYCGPPPVGGHAV